MEVKVFFLHKLEFCLVVLAFDLSEFNKCANEDVLFVRLVESCFDCGGIVSGGAFGTNACVLATVDTNTMGVG